MTYKRLNYLLLFILSVLFCWLIIASTARAETDFSWHVNGYLAANLADDAGYDPGVGGVGELYGRWRFLEAKLSGALMAQHKKKASSGYTYSYGAEGRGYVYGPWYLLYAVKFMGYRSEFDTGAIWEKNGHNVGFGAGFNNGSTDVNYTYFLQENESPNNVQFWTIGVRQHIWEMMDGMLNVTRQSFDQVAGGTIERWSAWTVTIGLGVRW